jgi:hypothetical protein
MLSRESLISVRDAIQEVGHGATSYFRRMANRARLAKVSDRDQPIVEAMEAEGAYKTDLEKLAVSGSAELMRASDRLFDEMAQLKPKRGNKDYMIGGSPSVITKYPEILSWGLNERFLAIAENYIGMPVTYRGVLARLDMPDGTVRETRLWHLDQEDSRILKIVVYISDVDDDGGPFEYVPASFSQPRHLTRGSKKRVDNEAALDRAVPPESRGAVIGPRGTVGFVDTCRVLHRGRLPLNGTRKSLFFAYNSRWPLRPSHCGPMFLVDKYKAAVGTLTPHQPDALDFGYYRRFE